MKESEGVLYVSRRNDKYGVRVCDKVVLLPRYVVCCGSTDQTTRTEVQSALQPRRVPVPPSLTTEKEKAPAPVRTPVFVLALSP